METTGGRRWTPAVVVLAALAIAAFNVYAYRQPEEHRRKALFFVQLTFFFTGVLAALLYFYLYPFFFSNVRWSPHSTLRRILRMGFFTMSAAVLSVYPLLRAGTMLMPKAKEPLPLMLAGFGLFGYFLITFVVAVLVDILERCLAFGCVFLGATAGTDAPAAPAGGLPQAAEPSLTATDDAAAVQSVSHATSAAPGARSRRRLVVAQELPASPSVAGVSEAAPSQPVASGKATTWLFTLSSAIGVAFACKRMRSPGLPLCVLVMSSIISFAAILGATAPAGVTEIHITLPRLPAELDGFRIAQLSDVHVGPTVGYSQLNGVVETANALQPDLIALTGDFIDGDESVFETSLEPLRRLQTTARYGNGKEVYFVSGNHDHYDGSFPGKVRMLQERGVNVLLNERVAIPRVAGVPTFDLVGVSDWAASPLSGPQFSTNLTRAMDGAEPSRESVLLAHQPKHADQAARAMIGLHLCGHTHGGQIFPLHILVYLGNPYFAGLYARTVEASPGVQDAAAAAVRGLRQRPQPLLRGPLRTDEAALADALTAGNWVTQIYVNRGSIYWGPPMRLFAPQEVTLVVLHSAHTPARVNTD